jgi:hypothetical protein
MAVSGCMPWQACREPCIILRLTLLWHAASAAAERACVYTCQDLLCSIKKRIICIAIYIFGQCHSIGHLSFCGMSSSLHDNRNNGAITVGTYLMPIFRERFIADGNFYDFKNQSRFTEEDIKKAMDEGSGVITKRKQCTDWVRQTYIKPSTEALFRKRIGVAKDMTEFDVVKKRRLMEEAIARGDGGSNDDSPEALAAFEEFEASTLHALTAIHDDELLNYTREATEMAESGVAYGTSGGVYFAVTEALPGYIKIGCTRRHDPMLRIGELSRCVPIPFNLMRWIPTSNPFGLEAMIHKFFAAKRVRNKGAGTEFFAMAVDAIQTLPPSLMQDPKTTPRPRRSYDWRKRAEAVAARASVMKHRQRQLMAASGGSMRK